MAPLKAALCALTGLLALPLAAQDAPRALEQGRLTVYYQPRDEEFAKVALRAAAEALPVLENSLTLKPEAHQEKPPIRLQIVRTREELATAAGREMPPWIQGLALPGRRIVVQTLAPATMKLTVAHELTHVLLDEVAFSLQVEPPRWLHEGLAKYTTGDFSEGDREVLGRAVVERRLIPLGQLETAFGGDRDRVSLAYAQSYTLVRFLHELQPGGGLAAFLRNLALTGDVDRALLRTYGQPVDKLQADWIAQIQREYLKHGLDLLTESLLFGLMALLFVGVYLVVRRRRAQIRQRLQEEERLRRMLGYVDEDEDGPDPELHEDY